jgi:hypothetical protein
MAKQFVFPLDKAKFSTKAQMYAYIEEKYPNLLSDDMSPARLYFNMKYKKTHGRSVLSGKPTPWNEVTERYERFANEEERIQYRDDFKKKMMAKYGKFHILDDPEQQKKMLDNRSISKDYVWNNGDVTRVTGDYEFDFLKYLEVVYKFNAQCFAPPPTIYYKQGDVASFYLPDFYIPSLNLIIEIKGSNGHYQARDEYKEELKAKATKDEGFEFIQLTDHIFLPFNEYFARTVINN